MTRHGIFATAVALRGISLIDAISPKISPFPILPMALFLAIRLTSPSRSRYILSRWSRSLLPFSFSVTGASPSEKGRQLRHPLWPLAARARNRARARRRDVTAGVDRGEEHHRSLARKQADHCRTRAAVRNVHQLHAGHHVEELAREVRRAARA